ncbi:MAG: bifunctional alpha,alpha-trehalose-phosphate synthase (UDP-forming)/trehalose-phosphatase [Planctomycetes bacterium]|nr:bifunctional alpha,alpha-trehalose-phosphate synthase (UDP-forming)/trehalose-phosphatase [Planctomycetota bacterium]
MSTTLSIPADAAAATPAADAAADGDGEPPEPHLVVVSNRLPVSLEIEGEHWRSHASSGGLVAALDGLARGGAMTWIGWPGCTVPDALAADVRAELARDGLIAVLLSADEERSYYQGMANEVLWPLFHYFTDKVHFEPEHWRGYEQINRRFATAVLESAPHGSRVWIHDFHLMLVPGLLRAARPDLEIGFFLHVPWPSSELFRLLPPRREILRGLLGADYVAFHTSDYAMHFRTSCMRLLGLDSDPDGIRLEGRTVGIGRHPIGIDAAHFDRVMRAPQTVATYADYRARYGGKKLLLSVSRLDYTKGLLHELSAFEALLAEQPALAGEVTMLQVVVPSRTKTPEYAELRQQVERQVARINGRFGGPGRTPVDYVFRSLEPNELVALYQLADVAVVTPIRDGMNLVAQEYVHCQRDGRGILVLSEFAGAAHLLGDALLVNPWDIEQFRRALAEALRLPNAERDARMRPMIDRIGAMDCRSWARAFLAKLAAATERRRHEQRNHRVLDRAAQAELTRRLATAPARLLIVAYDGTLAELANRPERAAPTPEIVGLLRRLGALPATEVHLLSSRQAAALATWFGDLDIHLAAEYGTVTRARGASEWSAATVFELGWQPAVEAILAEVTAEVLGSRIERKRFSLAWHYREADPEYGLWAASGLLMRLESEAHGLGLEFIHGDRVIEIRPVRADKGEYVRRVLAATKPGTSVLCIGDDRTDHEMYEALQHVAGSCCAHVGTDAPHADWLIESPAEVRALLRALIASLTAAADGARTDASTRS